MSLSGGVLGSFGRLFSQSQRNAVVQRPEALSIQGSFRLVQRDAAGCVIADSGEIRNCITSEGVTDLLARWIFLNGTDTVTDYDSSFTGRTTPLWKMGLGVGTDLAYDYYTHTTLQSTAGFGASYVAAPITKLADVAAADAALTVRILTGASVREAPSRLVFTGSWKAGIVVAAGASIEISEIGMTDNGVPTLFSAACFSPVYIIGDQPLSAYYTISLSQTALA